jgi:hypothetical protein
VKRPATLRRSASRRAVATALALVAGIFLLYFAAMTAAKPSLQQNPPAHGAVSTDRPRAGIDNLHAWAVSANFATITSAVHPRMSLLVGCHGLVSLSTEVRDVQNTEALHQLNGRKAWFGMFIDRDPEVVVEATVSVIETPRGVTAGQVGWLGRSTVEALRTERTGRSVVVTNGVESYTFSLNGCAEAIASLQCDDVQWNADTVIGAPSSL